ncbi:MAG: hypothetical protein JNK10_06285, partial [Cyclobacteriaceae bacterium]|nr:hypothetical protein [Cyclobacteriaceae bacterium]
MSAYKASRYSAAFVATCLFCHALPGQTPASLNYDYRKGMPSNEVYDIMQDSAGFIWFSTDNGIVSFDGETLRPYSAKDGLVDPVVFGMHPDSQGRVWLRTYSGKHAYLEGDSIRPYRFNHVLHPLARYSLFQAIHAYPDGSLRFAAGYFTGLITASGELSLDSIKRPGLLVTLHDDLAFLACYGRRSRIQHITINSVSHPIQLSDTLMRNQVISAQRWKEQWLFAINNNIFSYDGQQIKRVFTGKGAIISLSVDREDHLWVGYVNDGAERFVDTHFKATIRPFGFAASVTRVLQDKEGGFWFSTLEKGVYYIPNLSILQAPLPGQSKIRLALEHQGGLLLGDQSGKLMMLDSNLTVTSLTQGNHGYLSAFRDRQRKIWISTTSTVEILDSNLVTLQTIPRISKVAFSETPGRKVWATGGSNTRFDTHGEIEVHNYQSDGRSIFANDSAVFVGDRVGMSIYDNDLKLRTQPSVLAQYKITHLLSIDSSTLLIGTMGSGLIAFDLRTLKPREPFELPFRASNIFALLKTDSSLVISTENGVFESTLKSLRSSRPFFRSILGHPELTSKVDFLVADKHAVIAIEGKTITVIPWRTRNTLNMNPTFYLKRVVVNNRNVHAQGLDLDNGQHQVRLDFGIQSFNNRNIFVRFRLKKDEPWQYTTKNSIELFALGAGTYEVDIQYSVDQEHWLKGLSGYPIKIQPPWWQSWYFIIGSILATAGIITTVAFYQTENLKTRQKYLRLEFDVQQNLLNFELEAVERERSRVAKELHDSVNSHIQAVRMAIKYNHAEPDHLDTLLQVTLRELKTIIYNLAPP